MLGGCGEGGKFESIVHTCSMVLARCACNTCAIDRATVLSTQHKLQPHGHSARLTETFSIQLRCTLLAFVVVVVIIAVVAPLRSVHTLCQPVMIKMCESNRSAVLQRQRDQTNGRLFVECLAACTSKINVLEIIINVGCFFCSLYVLSNNCEHNLFGALRSQLSLHLRGVFVCTTILSHDTTVPNGKLCHRGS